MFSFDRSICELIAKDLLEDLQEAEHKWRLNSLEWQRKISRWNEWKTGEKLRQKVAERAKKGKKSEDEEPERPSVDTSWEASFDPADPSAQFSFAGLSKYSKDELEEEITRMMRWKDIEPWVADALRRGIAVHHAGMAKSYRALIERLVTRNEATSFVPSNCL
jgi:ATP-dependent RNA helicase DDX60